MGKARAEQTRLRAVAEILKSPHGNCYVTVALQAVLLFHGSYLYEARAKLLVLRG